MDISDVYELEIRKNGGDGWTAQALEAQMMAEWFYSDGWETIYGMYENATGVDLNTYRVSPYWITEQFRKLFFGEYNGDYMVTDSEVIMFLNPGFFERLEKNIRVMLDCAGEW